MIFFPLTFLSIFIIAPGLQDKYGLIKTLWLALAALWAAYSLLTRGMQGGNIHLPLLGSITALLGVIGFSYFQAINPYEYVKQVGLDVMGIIFFWYAANVSRETLRRILLILLGFLVIHAVLPNTMGNPGYRAIVLVMGIPIAAHFMLQARRVLSFLGRKMDIALGVIALCFVIAIHFNISPDTSFYKTRLTWLKNTTAMIADHPLWGVGRGNWSMIYPVYAQVYGDPYMGTLERDLGLGKRVKVYVNAAHNDWLQLTAETGILGLGVFSWLMWGILRSVVWQDSMSVALFASVLGFLGIALVHFPFQLVVPSMLFWMMSGFLVRRRYEKVDDNLVD